MERNTKIAIGAGVGYLIWQKFKGILSLLFLIFVIIVIWAVVDDPEDNSKAGSTSSYSKRATRLLTSPEQIFMVEPNGLSGDNLRDFSTAMAAAKEGDYSKASNWFAMALSLDDKTDAPIYHIFGLMHFNGLDHRRSYAEAHDYWKQAQRAGYAPSKRVLDEVWRDKGTFWWKD